MEFFFGLLARFFAYAAELELNFVVVLFCLGLFLSGILWGIGFLLFEVVERPRYHFARKRFWAAVRRGEHPEHPPRRNVYGGLWHTDTNDFIRCDRVQRQVRAARELAEKLGLKNSLYD